MMKVFHTKSLILFLGVVLLLVSPAKAQDIDKDVTVVTAYQPTLQDANKMSLLPEFNDTSIVQPGFEYHITPVYFFTSFIPRPVSAAKMAQEPLANIYNNYIRLGMGNPLAPLAQVYVTNGRSKENTMGIFLHHASANGIVKLLNNNKIQAPFAQNSVQLFGKHLFDKSYINGYINYYNNKSVFYGYDPTAALPYFKNDNQQRYQIIEAKGELGSRTNDKDMSYSVQGSYDYLFDNFSIADNHMLLAGKVLKNLDAFSVQAESGYESSIAGGANDTAYNNLFYLKPTFIREKEDWRLEIGFDAFYHSNFSHSQFMPFPRAKFAFTIAPEVLSIFVSYEGYIKSVPLSRTAIFNPFINPGLRLRDAICKTSVTFGLNGNLSKKLHIAATANYSEIDDQYFFVTDTAGLRNKFAAVYDNIEQLQVEGEMQYAATDKLMVEARATYVRFKNFRILKPWHRPTFESELTLRYNLRDKILAHASMFFVGQRYAQGLTTTSVIPLKPFADINMGAEYRYSNLFSLFVDFKNITANAYQYWNQYPVYTFQVMGGFTYSF